MKISKRYILFFLALITLRVVCNSTHITPRLNLAKTPLFAIGDIESQMAIGMKLSIFSADLYSLELQPGVTPKNAFHIYMFQRNLYQYYCLEKRGSRVETLRLVPGIGASTAGKYSEIFDFNCLS